MPERPIGSALKALAGRNVSRGFESRPLCLTNYRLDRRYVLPAIGLHLIAAGIAAALAFWVWPPIGILVGLLALSALRLLVWPPIAIRTDPEGVRLGGPLSRSSVGITWAGVEDVDRDGSRLYVRPSSGETVVLMLARVGDRSDELVRDVYQRLNTAHGYRRFDPEKD
ncbi:MAG: hypothetical protein JWQ91_2640 [Aeromicrobium sp.]|nr:hypothetical protein [Aeromicrobium sp.]MCW2825723.1 hypothetical protein [Aeromicrobium sp.]